MDEFVKHSSSAVDIKTVLMQVDLFVVCLSVCLFLPVCLSPCLSVCPSECQFVTLTVRLSVMLNFQAVQLISKLF